MLGSSCTGLPLAPLYRFTFSSSVYSSYLCYNSVHLQANYWTKFLLTGLVQISYFKSALSTVLYRSTIRKYLSLGRCKLEQCKYVPQKMNAELWAGQFSTVIWEVEDMYTILLLYFWKVSLPVNKWLVITDSQWSAEVWKKSRFFSKLEYKQREKGNHKRCMPPPNIEIDTAICCSSLSEYKMLCYDITAVFHKLILYYYAGLGCDYH